MRLKLAAFIFSALGLALPAAALAAGAKDPHCTDTKSGKPVDCVPATFTTFDIPFAKLPGGRMNAKGELDPTSSPEDAHKGAFVAAKKLGLFRNFEWVHWVPTAS